MALTLRNSKVGFVFMLRIQEILPIVKFVVVICLSKTGISHQKGRMSSRKFEMRPLVCT